MTADRQDNGAFYPIGSDGRTGGWRWWRRRAARGADVRRARRRRRRRRLLTLVLLALVVAIGWSVLFIATQCTGSGDGSGRAAGSVPPELRNYARDESLTYLTYPEWSIVYAAEEYARFIASHRPSGYPYFGSIKQYWSGYDAVCEVTSKEYAFNAGYHVMLGVIGTSFSVEHVIKGVYENTIGRVTEWLGTTDTPEDRLAIRTAREYGAFMHMVPWYEFPFAAKLSALWRDTPWRGPHLIRKWERRVALSAEYGVKAVYGWAIRAATQSAYGADASSIHAWIENVPDTVFTNPQVRRVKQLGPGAFIVTLPRYEAFTQTVLALLPEGVTLVNVAGNDEILVTAIAPRTVGDTLPVGTIVARLPMLTDPRQARLGIRTPVRRLGDLIAWLKAQGATVEHLYDY